MNAPSARGLFRATGKAAKPVMVDLIDGEAVYADEVERMKDDFYPTLPEPTRAFLHAEHDRLMQFPLIWEPAAGDGAMVREIEAMGHKVDASDLIDRGCHAKIKSFYDFDVLDAPSIAIVTNPPFKDCDGESRWLWHALDTLRVEYMALLLPWKWPCAAGKASIWTAHPPARVYLMRWRIDWTGAGANPSNDAWYVWDGKTQIGDTRLLMLDRKDARQGELFGGAS